MGLSPDLFFVPIVQNSDEFDLAVFNSSNFMINKYFNPLLSLDKEIKTRNKYSDPEYIADMFYLNLGSNLKSLDETDINNMPDNFPYKNHIQTTLKGVDKFIADIKTHASQKYLLINGIDAPIILF